MTADQVKLALIALELNLTDREAAAVNSFSER